MPITIAICDDEKYIREEIKRLVLLQDADCRVYLFSSGEALLTDGGDYDVIFLDIQMDRLTGLETAARLRKRQAEQSKPKSVIIFVTGLAEHMQDAFDVNAFHYLLKPIKSPKFNSVFQKALQEFSETRERSQKHILLQCKDMSRRVFHKDILFVESNNKQVLLHCIDGKIEHYTKMEDMESLLGNGFFRCHRCYLVNMEHIVRYNAAEITVSGGGQVPLAQKKYSPFVSAYLLYARKGGRGYE